MAKEEKKLYEKVALEVSKYELAYYQHLLLTEMVFRKLTHPLERTDEIVKKVNNEEVPQKYKKYKGQYPMTVSVQKELNNLESALDESPNLPDEAKNGWIVSNAVKHIAKAVLDD